MSALLDVAAVERNADGYSWPSGYQFDSIGCALQSFTSNVCAPITRTQLTGSGGDTEGLDANIFAVLVSLEGRAMCASGSEPDIVQAAVDAELEKAAGVALWGGTGDNPDVSLVGPDVATVAAGASTTATVAALLEEFWGRATGVKHTETVLHLGVAPLLEMFGQIEGSLLKNLDIKVATSPGYPVGAIGITGPIRMKVTDIETLETYNSNDNTHLTEASVLASLEFDPCTAVRVA